MINFDELTDEQRRAALEKNVRQQGQLLDGVIKACQFLIEAAELQKGLSGLALELGDDQDQLTYPEDWADAIRQGLEAITPDPSLQLN